MAAFEFVALDAEGRQKKGVLEGDNARQIRQQLRERQWIPLEVNPVVHQEQRLAKRRWQWRRGISAAELALITRQLSTLIKAALPIEEALRAVAAQSEKSRIKSMILAVRARVVEGHTFAQGLGEFPHIFNHLYCTMVAAGERSGHLDDVLLRLADYTEKRQQIRQKIQLAMLYPSILTTIAIAVVVGLLTYVVPKVVDQFEKMGQDLPLLTRVLIGISDFMRAYGWIVLLLGVATFIIARYSLRYPHVRAGFDRMLLHAPLIGKVIRGLHTARFARTLSIMTASNVPVLEALHISGEVLGNGVLRAAVAEAAVRVREGSSLRAALSKSGYFPPMMMHMIASGESSGDLEQMLERAADNQDREFEMQVALTLGLFEPMLILLMGGVVLCIVLAILMPIFQLNTLINP